MEITIDLPFDPEQVSLLDMHSVLNVLNVVQYELVLLGEKLEYPSELDDLIDATAQAGEDLVDPDKALLHIQTIADFTRKVEEVIQGLKPLAGKKGEEQMLSRTRGNLTGIFEVLKVRAQEILARQSNPRAWEWHDLTRLRDNFTQVFKAIERNSKGGYHIVHNLAQHEEGDYLVHFDISSEDGLHVRMPSVFQDVMRDLLANARKYTPPGGTITAGLADEKDELRFVVSDTGCGIPGNEVAEVVKFGYRASNVQDRPTRGGGFGLTKAYYTTRTFGGRMWIESPVDQNRGTRVEIRLPRKEEEEKG